MNRPQNLHARGRRILSYSADKKMAWIGVLPSSSPYALCEAHDALQINSGLRALVVHKIYGIFHFPEASSTMVQILGVLTLKNWVSPPWAFLGGVKSSEGRCGRSKCFSPSSHNILTL